MGKDFLRDFKISISKEALATLPPATFCGEIRIVDKEEDVLPAIETLRNSKVVGFDTETRPSFKKGQIYLVSLMQLSTKNECFLFRLNKIGLHPLLLQYLRDSNCLKIGLSLHDDFHNLEKLNADIEPKGFIDLQDYVKLWKIADTSLTKIHAILFGQRISKSQRLTNWEADSLTIHQQQYASLDAMACIRIYEFLKNNNFNPEESQYKVFPSEDEDLHHLTK
ncbi:MAG: 3'-5' exonuclease domain-containing protein 2 [Prevotella sp.]|nr:3'-5' exonuclease domain-containing protein 2 [Bacteroides sp.]MCM1366676.1 3'-5' exonuclease domain-containing protein 2 [Prevotella sp.]